MKKFVCCVFVVLFFLQNWVFAEKGFEESMAGFGLSANAANSNCNQLTNSDVCNKRRAFFKERILKRVETRTGLANLNNLRVVANELFDKVVEFIKISDEKNIGPQIFYDYVTEYLRLNSSEQSHSLFSKEEFDKICGLDGAAVVYINAYRGVLLENLKERFFNWKFFNENRNGLFKFGDYSYFHHFTIFDCFPYEESGYLTKVDGAGTSFKVGTANKNFLKAVIFPAKMKIIEDNYLNDVIDVLKHDRIDLFDLYKNRHIYHFDLDFYYSSEYEILSEALKKTFGKDYYDLFMHLNPNFDSLSVEEQEDVARNFHIFVNNLKNDYAPLAIEYRKVCENYDRNLYCTNKLYFVLSDLELCAKLLGYQAIGTKSSDGKNEWISFRIVDPGCVSMLMEITDQPDLNFDEIVKKI